LLAETLASLAARVLPPSRREWSAAMRAEVHCIGGDGEALRWALGCLGTGLLERCRTGTLLDLRLVRWTVAAWILVQIEGNLCSSFLVLSYKLQYLGMTQFLSRCSDADDYRALVPLLDATRVWEPMVCLLIAILYLLGIAAVLRRNRSAYRFFVLALLADIGLWFYELTKPLFVEAYSRADLRHDAFLYTVTALVIAALWQGARPPRALMA
jgi:hypothetical protein